MMGTVMPNGWPRGRALPQGWSAPLLSEVAHRESGHTPERGVPEYWNGGIKWLSLVDCDRLNRIHVGETTYTISSEGIKNSSAKLLPEGVVVLSRDAGVGQSSITTTPMAVSQHFLAWQCSEKLEPLFLYYWFQFIRPELERIAVGSTIKTIGLPYFNRMRIPLPPPTIQKKSANAFFWLDQVTYRLDEIIGAKREYKRGLAQQLLTGKMRFQEFKNTPWHTSFLEDHVKVVTRKNTDGQTLVLTASGEHGLVDQRRYFNRNVSGADLSRYQLIKRGEFAYNRSAMIGYPYGATKRLDAHEEGVLSTLYLCFAITDPELDSDYLSHVFESGVINRQLRPIVRVGARAHGLLNVTDDDFLSVSIPLPELKEQRRISKVLNELNSEIGSLEKQRDLFQDYKRGLMDRLLCGEIPVAA